MNMNLFAFRCNIVFGVAPYFRTRMDPGSRNTVHGHSLKFVALDHFGNENYVRLLLWWQHRKPELPGIKQLIINLDNGPECNGRRSQFLLRMTEFADLTGLGVRLVYYPPYHSKYNAIERYWAGLEKSWNGYLLSTVDTVINRAGNFYWKGIRTMACLVDAIYEKGVKLCGNEKRNLEHRLQRSAELNLWDIVIRPKTVLL